MTRSIEIQTAENWLANGTITVSSVGNENTYYTDQFGIEYFCKNMPSEFDYWRHNLSLTFGNEWDALG